uniref:Prepilin-type N-terminal cleavage/methylation domain-containing protein n=1 Tax=candidate division WOR-3 bacterium TaxID=2052148 RepID=A0A7C4Y6P7_UNCW3
MFKSKGFSIIELIISITIISIILLGFSGLSIYNLRLTRKINNLRNAKEIAYQKLRFLNSLPFDSEYLKKGLHSFEKIEDKFVISYLVKENEKMKGIKWIELFVYIIPDKDSLKFTYFITETKYEKIYTK